MLIFQTCIPKGGKKLGNGIFNAQKQKWSWKANARELKKIEMQMQQVMQVQASLGTQLVAG